MMATADGRPCVALYHHLPPGGADRAMYELVKRTKDRFRYVLFEITPGRRDPFDGATRAPLHDVVDTVHSFRARSGGTSQLGQWGITIPSILRAERKIARHIESSDQFDLLLAHHQRFLQAPSLLRTTSVPSAYFMQEPRRRSFEYDLRHNPADSVLKRALIAPVDAAARRHDIKCTRAADLLLCNSDHSRENIWRSYGRDATVVPLGVDGDHFVLGEAGPRDAEIVAVGSLDPTKGHELAIEAVSQIAVSLRPRLRIIFNRGDASAAEALRLQSERLGVELILDSNVSEDMLVQRYQRAAVVLLTGRVEPLGLTAHESLACGTPVVAVREGGYRETLVHGVTGLLTERRADDLAAALQRILSGDFAPGAESVRSAILEVSNWDRAAATYSEAISALVS